MNCAATLTTGGVTCRCEKTEPHDAHFNRVGGSWTGMRITHLPFNITATDPGAQEVFDRIRRAR